MKRSFVPYLLLLLVACSKGSGKDKDYDPPVLSLNTPANNQVYTAGQNIMISGSASDNKFINQIHVVISNQVTGAEFLHIHIHPNSNSFNFNESYTAQAGVSYKIDVIVDDPSANSSAKTVQIICN